MRATFDMEITLREVAQILFYLLEKLTYVAPSIRNKLPSKMLKILINLHKMTSSGSLFKSTVTANLKEIFNTSDGTFSLRGQLTNNDPNDWMAICLCFTSKISIISAFIISLLIVVLATGSLVLIIFRP